MSSRPKKVVWRFVRRRSPFQPGDGLLVHTRTAIGRAIARIEGNDLFGHGLVFNTSTQVVGIDEHGCRMLDPWAEGFSGVVLRLLDPLSVPELRQGQAWLRDQIGKPYPFLQMPLLYLLYKMDAVAPGIRRSARVFSMARVCTAFMAEFWRRCGRDVVPGVHESVESFSDFLESEQLGKFSKFPPSETFDPSTSWPPLHIKGPLKLTRR